MTTDMTPLATKLDIKMLMDAIGKLYDANQRWKDEIIGKTDNRIAASEQRMKLHFDVAVEHFQQGLKTINTEKIFEHGDRITALEVHTGLARTA